MVGPLDFIVDSNLLQVLYSPPNLECPFMLAFPSLGHCLLCNSGILTSLNAGNARYKGGRTFIQAEKRKIN